MKAVGQAHRAMLNPAHRWCIPRHPACHWTGVRPCATTSCTCALRAPSDRAASIPTSMRVSHDASSPTNCRASMRARACDSPIMPWHCRAHCSPRAGSTCSRIICRPTGWSARAMSATPAIWAWSCSCSFSCRPAGARSSAACCSGRGWSIPRSLRWVMTRDCRWCRTRATSYPSPGNFPWAAGRRGCRRAVTTWVPRA